MRLHSTVRDRSLVALAAVAVVLASCGGDAGDGADQAAEDVVEVSTTDTGDTASSPPVDDAPTREVVDDGPEAFVDQLGCRMAPDDAVAALRAVVAPELELAPAVAAPVEDDELGGLAIGVMVGDPDRTVAVWHWDEDAGLLRPLTPEAVTLEGAGADASLVPEPGAGGVVTWTGELGQPLAQDCATFVGQAAFPAPPSPEPEVRDDLVVVSPATVAAGEVLEVTFPEGYDRGVAYVLQRETTPGTWVDEWWMTSDANGGEPATVPAGTDGYGYPDVGVGGVGPDRLLVDPATAPGDHRLCTANALVDVCALVTVEG